ERRPGANPSDGLVERVAELGAHAAHRLAGKAAHERVLVVADDDERVPGARQLEDLFGARAAVDEIADEDEPMARRIEARGLEEVEELLVTALHVSDDEELLVHGTHCNRSPAGRIQRSCTASHTKNRRVTSSRWRRRGTSAD